MTNPIQRSPMACIGVGVVAFAMTVMVATPVMSEETEQVFGDWTYISSPDELDDTVQHIASTVAKKPQSRGMLVIKCDYVGGKVYSMYIPKKYMGNDDDTKITYRIDKNASKTEWWRYHGSTVVNFNAKPVKAFATELMNGNKLIIQAYDFDFNSVRHTFSLKGASAAIGRVLKNCNTSAPVKKQSNTARDYNVRPKQVHEPVYKVQPSTPDIYQWEQIKDSRNPALFDDFLVMFPNSKMVPLARNRLAGLRVKQ